MFYRVVSLIEITPDQIGRNPNGVLDIIKSYHFDDFYARDGHTRNFVVEFDPMPIEEQVAQQQKHNVFPFDPAFEQRQQEIEQEEMRYRANGNQF